MDVVGIHVYQHMYCILFVSVHVVGIGGGIYQQMYCILFASVNVVGIYYVYVCKETIFK